ncbi:MAG: HDOD domain-containing protein [Deltaproteobacteria bacterium]|nr:HDOD domain-containing protein [Deltaproteobacteria bacterium]
MSTVITKLIRRAAAQLPPFPRVAEKVLQLLQDPDVGVGSLVEVVQLDASLTSNILKVVNSPVYGVIHRVDNLSQALAILGNRPFAEVVFSSASAELLSQRQAGYDLDKGELWQHSLATALMTQVLAEQVGHTPGPSLYTGALLHDIGKVVLSQFVSNKYEMILEEVRQGRPFLEAERDILGLDHAELGYEIAKGWHFSQDMCDLIRYHHDPAPKRGSRDLAVLYVANVACQNLGLGGGADGVAQAWDEDALASLGLTELGLQLALADLQLRLAEAESLLGMAS